jgi:hypothetical protein
VARRSHAHLGAEQERGGRVDGLDFDRRLVGKAERRPAGPTLELVGRVEELGAAARAAERTRALLADEGRAVLPLGPARA